MLKEIFKNHWLSIGFTYIVFLSEFTLFAMLPWLLGQAVNQLIQKDYNLLIWYISCCVLGLLLGFFRRRLDTRVFISIWVAYTTKAIVNLIERKIDPARIASRAAFIRHYSDFFEYTMPMMMSNIVNIIISLVMISIASGKSGVFVFLCTILGLVLSYFWSCKIQQVEISTQETREEIHSAIISQDIPIIEDGYKVQLKRFIQRSDMEANVWSFIDILATSSDIMIIMMLLVVNLDHSNINEMVGTIMATITYNARIWARVDNLSQLFTQLKNVEIADELLNKES